VVGRPEWRTTVRRGLVALVAGAVVATVHWAQEPRTPAVVWGGTDDSNEIVEFEVPEFSLPTVEGGTFGRDCLFGSRSALVFLNGGCRFCKMMVERLSGLETRDGWSVAVVWHGSLAESERAAARLGAELTVAVDSTGVVHKAFGVTAVPQTLLLDDQGRLERAVKGWPSAWEALEEAGVSDAAR